jgi:hypothetical protein
MNNTADQIQAVRTMLGLAKFTKKRGLKAAAYRAAGLYLERMRKGRTKTEWVDLVRTAIPMSEARAYELMRLAAGKTSLGEHRAAGAERARKHYRAKSKGRGEIPHVEGASNVQRGHKKAEQNQ